ncbi:calcium-binding protein [Microvirga flavescens]|uniref:calcium-binding protein n=1 Tax=Microvirga flavescens TaxID=2249811 RepID=UPI000DD8E1E2|nr:calcium-binding protein [Microvirga flavescens]
MTTQPDSTLIALANGAYLSIWTVGADSSAIEGQVTNARTSAKGAVFSIAASAGVTRSHLSATELSDGRLVVIWEETSTAGKHTIKGRVFGSDTASASDIFEIGPSAANRTSPNVVADQYGGFSVIANDGPKVTRVDVNAAGDQSSATVLMDEGFNPSVAVLSSGAVITVASIAAESGGYEIAGVMQGADGVILMSKVLAVRNEPTPSHPTVTGLSDGKYVVAWEGVLGGQQSVIFQTYLMGTPWGGASHFDPLSAGQVFANPVVMALSGGGYAYAATHGTASDADIYVGSVRNSSADMSADLINASSTGHQIDPTIAMLRDGRHVISWLEASGSTFAVKTKVFDARSAGVNVTGTAGSDDYRGTSNDDSLSGLGGDDYLEGNGGNDVLNGGTGADTMVGGVDFWSKNNTTYHVDTALDKCIETSDGGTDKIVTSVDWTLGSYIENLTAIGSDALVLTGNSLANTITGNSGNNKISGGLGKDTLKGGEGRDIFVFNTKLSKTNIDTILDFAVKEDVIHLDNKYMSKLGKGSPTKPIKLSSKMFWTGAAAHDADDRVIYNKKTGALLYDADGSGSGAAVQIATLSKNLKLKADKFFVI